MTTNRAFATALVLDLASVVTFVVVGRQSHQESQALVDIARTTAPFALGLAWGWLAARVWAAPLRLRTGLVIWVTTLIVGMAARRLLMGEGIATSFIIVAGLFLLACFAGWRLVARLLGSRAGRDGQPALPGTEVGA